MRPPESIVPIDVNGLKAGAAAKKAEGWRLVLITALENAEGIELSYSFEKDQVFETLRLQRGAPPCSVPSITDSYLAAFTYENELQDLFGMTVEGLAIDFKGEFYMKSKPQPFLRGAAQGAGRG
jgi:ech hydrogenase subunit D